jgi:hypothetical protein
VIRSHQLGAARLQKHHPRPLPRLQDADALHGLPPGLLRVGRDMPALRTALSGRRVVAAGVRSRCPRSEHSISQSALAANDERRNHHAHGVGMTSPPIIRLIDELLEPSLNVRWLMEVGQRLKGDLASPTVAGAPSGLSRCASQAKPLIDYRERKHGRAAHRPTLILQGLQRG